MRRVLDRLFLPFEGKLNGRKYRRLSGVARISDDTVEGDLDFLVRAGMLHRVGRSPTAHREAETAKAHRG